MKPLIYFSYGMTKCGTTLAYHMVSEALAQAGAEQHRLPAHLIGSNKKLNFGSHFSEDQADELWQAVKSIGHPMVVKTHTRPDPAVVKLMQDGRAIAHACYRDPRDMALSMLDHGQRARAAGNPAFSEIVTLEDAKNGIRNQCDSLTAWLRLPNVLPLNFEDIAFDMPATVQRLLDQLKISGDPAKIAAKVLDGRFTQFNKGRPKRHKTEMSTQDNREFACEFAPFLSRLLDEQHMLPTYGNIPLPPPYELRDSV